MGGFSSSAFSSSAFSIASFWMSLDTVEVAPAEQDYAGSCPGVQVTPLWGRPLQPVIKRPRPRLTREKDLVLLGII